MMPVRCLADVLGSSDAPLSSPPMVPGSFDGWTFATAAAGVCLMPPDGRAAGEVTVHERHPLVSPGTLVAERVPVETVVTVEGEYAFLARHEISSLGVVIGDGWCLRVDGVARTPSLREAIDHAVRALVVHASLGLGERRRRWYLYRPPQGFHSAHRRGQVTEWRGAGGRITVYPAEPDRPSAPLLHRLSGVPTLTREHPGQFQPMSLGERRGLERTLFLGPEADTATDVAVLRDGRFRYVLRLDATPASQATVRVAFGALVDSVVPVPRVGRMRSDAFGHRAA